MKKTVSLILLIITLTNCERDDICAESTITTPRLVIDFLDNSDLESVKSVTSLRVQGVDNPDVLEGFDAVNSTQVQLPLKTDATSTSFKLHKAYSINDNGTPNDTSDDFTNGNEDIITINYSTEDIFVSRACGFKTIFKNISISLETDSDNWIQTIQAVTTNQNIEDETRTHFNIFH